MPEEVRTIVKIPISEIEESVRSKHLLPTELVEVHIEENALVLTFADEQRVNVIDEVGKPVSDVVHQKKRRSRKKRNRMRTRGWAVVASITNSKGQRCAIYKPFVDALISTRFTSEEQKKAVERILKSNKNKPSDASVQYFLENTIEYLHMKTGGSPTEINLPHGGDEN